MTGNHMIKTVAVVSLLAFSISGHAVLKLLLDGQSFDLQTAVLDTANGLLTVNSGVNLNCTGFITVDPANVPLAIKIDDNNIAEVDNITPGAFTIERLAADTIITVNTIDIVSCSNGPGLDEEFFEDGFEDPIPQ